MTDSRWPRIYCVSVLRVVHLLVVDEGPLRVKYACTVAILCLVSWPRHYCESGRDCHRDCLSSFVYETLNSISWAIVAHYCLIDFCDFKLF